MNLFCSYFGANFLPKQRLCDFAYLTYLSAIFSASTSASLAWSACSSLFLVLQLLQWIDPWIPLVKFSCKLRTLGILTQAVNWIEKRSEKARRALVLVNVLHWTLLKLHLTCCNLNKANCQSVLAKTSMVSIPAAITLLGRIFGSGSFPFAVIYNLSLANKAFSKCSRYYDSNIRVELLDQANMERS